MKLSIVIPLYNVENYINQCLNSILKQNIPAKDYEVLLIDDGSTDKSYSIAKKFTFNHSNLSIYHQKNQGVSIARNNGLQYAKGKYIYFVDSDDYIALGTLNQLVKYAINNNLDILEFANIRTKSRNFENSNTKNISTKYLNILEGKDYISTRHFNDAVWAYFYKRDFLLNSKIEFYEGRTKQDMIFNAELMSKAKRVAFYPIDVYRYVINPDSITTSTESGAARKSIEDFVYITMKYNELILKLENKKVNISILRHKQQMQLFNISRRLLQSDFKFSEITKILKQLSNHNLYPINAYKGKNIYRKLLIFIVNNKILFFLTHWLYKIFRVPFEYIVIKKHQNKKEKLINSFFE
jgi:glycosyltransferase involved in cell wall biosynthesis